MENKKKSKSLSRRRFMPLIGAAIFFPFVGRAIPVNNPEGSSKDPDEYDTLLTPDGEIVKVKRSAIKSGKVLKKRMSNKSLLGWLKPNKGTKR